MPTVAGAVPFRAAPGIDVRGGGWIPYVAGVQWMADDSTRATSVGYASKPHQWRVMAPKDG